MDDFLFGTWSGVGGLSLNDNVCAFIRPRTAPYNVQAIGDGGGGAFTLSNSIILTETLPYLVYWNDQASSSGRTQLTPNTPLTGQFSGGVNQTCRRGNQLNANLSIDMQESQLQSVVAGNYSGTLTIVIGAD